MSHERESCGFFWRLLDLTFTILTISNYEEYKTSIGVNMRNIYRIALVLSYLGFALSLFVHVRSLMGFGLRNWFLLPIFVFLPMGAWFMAVDDVLHGGIDRWQSPSLLTAESEMEKQMLWGQMLYRSLPTWAKLGNGLFVGYFLILAVQFLMKTNSANPFPQSSLRFIEAPLAAFLSCGCLGAYWIYLPTFMRVLKLK
jgi:hypothetical protein